MEVNGLTATLFYPTFLAITFALTLIFIPKSIYKTYLIYGLLIGGLGDTVIVFFMQNLLHILWFKNQGIFNVQGQIALSPLCWTVVVMLFLFFLPNQKWFRYPYIATWGLLSLGYGYVVKNVGLFDFRPWLYPIPAYLIFFCWWFFAALLFVNTSADNELEL